MIGFENGGMNIKVAIFPYVLLIVSVLLFQVPFISNIFPDISISLSFPEFTTDLGYYVQAEETFSPINIFSHPIFFLLISSIAGSILYYIKDHLNNEKLKKIFKRSYDKSNSSVLTVFTLMIMALILNNLGMIFNFAQGMARIGRFAFPIISPLIGVLGAFLTVSNTSSNVIFGAF